MKKVSLLITFVLAMVFLAIGQVKFQVYLKDGNIIESLASDIDSISFTYNEQGENDETESSLSPTLPFPPTYPYDANGYEYVDLGLSVKWATCNIGATKPEEDGLRFAWGETLAKSDDSDYYYDGTDKILPLINDAAHMDRGGNWRMPTYAEIEELLNNCDITTKKINNIEVRVFTSKINGESICLLKNYYWSCEKKNDTYAYDLNVMNKNISTSGCYNLYPIRPVLVETFAPIIKFDANGGVGNMGSQFLKYPQPVKLLSNRFTNEDFNFLGWNTKADGSGVAYTDEEEINISCNLTLYAQWEEKYNISFNPNGGIGTMNSERIIENTMYALPLNGFEKEGYVLMGWNTKADGSGVSYMKGEEIEVTSDVTLYAQWGEKNGVYGNVNGYDYVDLGLSVKWATCNVGATTAFDYGYYFAWGETSAKSTYGRSTYKWWNGDARLLTKYCTDSYCGTVDNKTTLDLSDDAASVNWGGSWRMPTHEEQEELYTKCTWTLVTRSGVNGYIVIGPNGNSIFLPLAGYICDANHSCAVGSTGVYMSSSLDDEGVECNDAFYSLRLYGSSVDCDGLNSRYDGHTVRPVLP